MSVAALRRTMLTRPALSENLYAPLQRPPDHYVPRSVLTAGAFVPPHHVS
ncbi:MAG: hypothetical protein U9R47_08955 [Actinomycetota bacterium]|nr:hypothetical protein [Actinomycetota bacterium]